MWDGNVPIHEWSYTGEYPPQKSVTEVGVKEKGTYIQYIQLGRPMQNGYIERFNRLYREAVLDAYLFFDLYQVRELTPQWMKEYNQKRPYESLGNLTSVEYKMLAGKKKNAQPIAV